jgi:dienelactone hydrolase
MSREDRQMGFPRRRARVLAIGGLVAFAISSAKALSSAPRPQTPRTESTVRFELASDDVLLDEVVPIVVTGLQPRATVTIRARSGGQQAWASSASFVTDESGRVDLARMAPTRGTYKEIDAMGLFWSAERESASGAPAADEDTAVGSPALWTLTAETDGRVVATTRIRRAAMAPGTRVTRVRESGLVGMLYEPPDDARHPALIVLGGSGGGLPPPAGVPGGLVSRGYVVFALAYFGVPGLPRTLSNIPLEYFGTAVQWLSAQPTVDPMRLGVAGASRGAELALLLGVTYPVLHAVVAYMPSDVIWRGCCDATTEVAWTIKGRPVATTATGLGGARAEIPVERIQGAVLLISGRDDGVWASSEMAERIVSRLRRNAFQFSCLSLVYDHAGHGITRPYSSTMELNSRRHPLTGRLIHMGGTPAGTAKASADSWRQMLEFVDQHLRHAV